MISATLFMWRSNVYLAEFFLSLLIIYFQLVESSECPESYTQSVNCTCNRLKPNQYELFCPRFVKSSNSYVLKAEFEDYKFKILCNHVKSAEELNILSGLNVGPVNTFMLSYCPIPNVSFKELLISMGINEIETLRIQSVSNFSILERRHLEGLTNLTKIDLMLAGLTELKEDLLMDLPNLKWLTLTNNNINHLPKGLFKYNPKVQVLELGNNNISYLEPGIFRNLSQLRLLNLWNNNLSNLTRGVFSDTPSLEMLDVHSNDMTSIAPDLFTDLVQLKRVSLLGNKISILPHGLLSSNPNLEYFTLTNNRVTLNIIPQGFLANITTLKEVSLFNCNISKIPNDLIWGSTDLNKILLFGNSLEELPADMFKDSLKLTYLDLSMNKLKALPTSLFTTTGKLTTLILHHNQISNISRDLFSNLINLNKLDLSFNKLFAIDSDTFASNSNLFEAYFSNNYLTFDDSSDPFQENDFFGPSSPFKFCRNIKKLDLKNNLITKIYKDWRDAVKLQMLDLRNNSFSYIETSDIHFHSAEKLIVDLSNNNISYIDLALLETLAMAQYDNEIKPHYQNPLKNQAARILLQGNPLKCDCKNYYLKKYFDNELTPEVKYLIDLDSDNLKCAGPQILQDMQFNDVPTKLLVCPVFGARENISLCPENCFCSFRPYDKGLIIDCQRRNIRFIPKNFLMGTLYMFKNPTSNLNHTELDLSQNFISHLPVDLDLGFEKVTKLILTNNNLTQIDLSKLPNNITNLMLNNNNLTSLSPDSIKYLDQSNQLRVVSLYNNPWTCNCDTKDLLNFIQNKFDKVDLRQNMTCADGKAMPLLTLDDICPYPTVAIITFSTIFLVTIFSVAIFIYYRKQYEIKVWLYAHRRFLWFVTENEPDEGKIYDAFVSYSHHDEDFVEKTLVPGLEEEEPKFKLCLHNRDWVVGDYIPNQITNSVQSSRRTLVVLSRNFLSSVWGKAEFKEAHAKAMQDGVARVIMIVYGDIGSTDDLDDDLKKYISTRTYIKWGDPLFWERLRYALPHPSKPSNNIDLFQRYLSKKENRPTNLYLEKDDLIKGKDPNCTPPSSTTPPANSFISNTPTLVPNGEIKSQ